MSLFAFKKSSLYRPQLFEAAKMALDAEAPRQVGPWCRWCRGCNATGLPRVLRGVLKMANSFIAFCALVVKINPMKHVAPLYTVNVSYERKLGIWRLSFLVGGCLAPKRLISECLSNLSVAGVDRLQENTFRVYSGKWREIAEASHAWMSKNKEVA